MSVKNVGQCLFPLQSLQLFLDQMLDRFILNNCLCWCPCFNIINTKPHTHNWIWGCFQMNFVGWLSYESFLIIARFFDHDIRWFQSCGQSVNTILSMIASSGVGCNQSYLSVSTVSVCFRNTSYRVSYFLFILLAVQVYLLCSFLCPFHMCLKSIA